MSNRVEIAVFGGGCFWCTEAVFKMLAGVREVVPGYAGGKVVNPTYEDVSSGTSGHAEVVSVTFDPQDILYTDLLTVFFATHDPTTKNRQGADIGSQYRSVIFYTSPTQRDVAENYINEINGEYERTIVTEVVPLDTFYPAEEYHMNYYGRNTQAPYCSVVIEPKIKKVAERFSKLMRKNT